MTRRSTHATVCDASADEGQRARRGIYQLSERPSGAPEEWRTIEELPAYEVSSMGRVRSWKRGNLFPQVLRTDAHDKGKGLLYQRMRLRDSGGIIVRRYVHRLVALAFLGEPPDGKTEIDHINGDSLDNRLENLRWVSRSENSINKYRLARARASERE